jgi:hypothetical protein
VPDDADWNGWDIPDDDYDPMEVSRNDCDQGVSPKGRDSQNYRDYWAAILSAKSNSGRTGAGHENVAEFDAVVGDSINKTGDEYAV